MPRASLLPRAEHLSVEPQLAALAVLETAANVAILALAAEYPELAHDDAHPRAPPALELGAAIDLIELARALDVMIARYKRAVAERHEREREEVDLLPF